LPTSNDGRADDGRSAILCEPDNPSPIARKATLELGGNAFTGSALSTSVYAAEQVSKDPYGRVPMAKRQGLFCSCDDGRCSGTPLDASTLRAAGRKSGTHFAM
jgi:hypothetical protein